MITVYTITFNGEILMQFMIDHYRKRFPGCRIILYDNMSNDDTVKIAKANDCEVIPFDTNNESRERLQLEIKNSCWKNAKTDWVLVCDLDELFDINEAQLKREENLGSTLIKCEFYDMINMEDNFDIAGMKYGVKSPMPGKFCLFNKKFLSEINYSPGAHQCNPSGDIAYSKNKYKVYHYVSINENLTIAKFKIYKKRMSQDNLDNGWGIQWLMTPEEIREEYAQERSKAVKVRQ